MVFQQPGPIRQSRQVPACVVGCDSRRISFLKCPPPPTASVHVWFIWFFWSFHRLQLVTEGQVNQLVLQEVEKCSSQWSFRGFPV